MNWFIRIPIINQIIKNNIVNNIIKKQYHCVGSISGGYIICPNCNIQSTHDIENNEDNFCIHLDKSKQNNTPKDEHQVNSTWWRYFPILV